MAEDAGIGAKGVDIEMTDMTESQRVRSSAAKKFGITFSELASPEAGMEDPTVFNWQSEEPLDLSQWGGIDGIVKSLHVDPKVGLDGDDAAGLEDRVHAFGSNARYVPPGVTYCELIWEGLHDFTLIILIVAAVVSTSLGVIEDPAGGWHEGVAILVAVVIVLNVGAFNDLQKDKKFRELNDENSRVMVKVLRNNTKQEMVIDDLVVGDIVLIEAGNKIPADGLFLEGDSVQCFEGAMTGESDLLKKSRAMPLLISGSECRAGNMRMIVVAVGGNSVSGRAMLLLNAEPEPTPLQAKLEHLATQVSKLGFFVAVICFSVMTITQVVEYSNREGACGAGDSANQATCAALADEAACKAADASLECAYTPAEWGSQDWKAVLEFFIIAVTVLVVAIPEGLPLAVTISLAYSVGKMMKDNILVRHLDACETMGGATTICTDKTGTLTQNKMTVVQGWVPRHTKKPNNQGSIFLSAHNTGTEQEHAEFIDNIKAADAKVVECLAENACLNSTAFLQIDKDTGLEKSIGSATEGALLVLARSLGSGYDERRDAVPKSCLYPFASARKRSSVLVWLGEKGASDRRLYVKGASEMVLRLCDRQLLADGTVVPLEGDFTITSEGDVHGTGDKCDIAKDVITAMADQALRTIALAYREFPQDAKGGGGGGGGGDGGGDGGDDGEGWVHEMVEYAPEEAKGSGPCPKVEDGLILLGVVGIQDPVRPEVPEAVRKCQNAGITVRMVTGDNIVTAKAIARQCGIFHDEVWTDPFGNGRPSGFAIEGPDFRKKMADEGDAYFSQMWPRLEVMARSAPEDKHQLVGSLMAKGQTVAVTGDGTNDGPALKISNVGFAMGIAGTDVAKQASDIILMDDNFKSIVQAVLWGRNVYDSIRKFLQFQLTVNVVALAVAFVAACLLKESPLKATQMLWVNLIMDTFAALALATEPPTPEVLERLPYGKTESLISRIMMRNIIGQSVFQMCIIFTYVYAGEVINNVPIGRQLGSGAAPTAHYTIVFNVFVMLQCFNEFVCRKCNGEKDYFKGMMLNPFFVGIVFFTFIMQVVLVEVGGTYVSVVPLTFEQHVASIIVGAFSLLNGYAIMLIPEDWFGTTGSKVLTDEERSKFATFTRRNSRMSVRSAPVVIGHTNGVRGRSGSAAMVLSKRGNTLMG